MANHKSAIKRFRQSVKRNLRNREARSAVRTELRQAKATIQGGDLTKAQELLRAAERTLAKAASKGIVHKKNAARRMSRLAKQANKKKQS